MKSDVKEYDKVIKAFEIKIAMMEQDIPKRKKANIDLRKILHDYKIQIQELEELIEKRLAKNGNKRRGQTKS